MKVGKVSFPFGVIDRLRFCMDGKCAECGYEDVCGMGYNVLIPRSLAGDLLKALEDAQPRILTLEEAYDADIVWFESRTIYDSEYGRVYAESGTYHTVCIKRIVNGNAFEDDRDYGISWRCWNMKPSLKMRKESPWKEEDDDKEEAEDE